MNIQSFIDANKSCRSRARFLVGPNASGKDTLIKDFAKRIGYNFLELRADQLEESDFSGLVYPTFNAAKNDCEWKWARPRWWDKYKRKYIVNISGTDRCDEHIRRVIEEIAIKRKVNGHTIPSHIIIFATGVSRPKEFEKFKLFKMAVW